ncbi:hypothetical protein SEVIR_8G175600v4 [Setaria viridis]|uniref:Uncharacterized protein n=1 Tax=Setaria viridis TaxID=4556 RepID=A0A4U6TI83_SETVI|nr:short-chain dehydrogenase TIC 32 A, chloroplastic-like isoform X1 [Setaria viridis]TKW01372.1 hypothetical protein SEVIR_8G175600v2 [Setaria viridis]
MRNFGCLTWRPRPSGFSAASTAEEVTAGLDGIHLTAIVTGATSGIGKETARVLLLRGVKVIIPARTMESGLRAKRSLTQGQGIPDSRLHVMEMDLSSLDSVQRFAQHFMSLHEHLNILINNAGIILFSFRPSEDGIEQQFATNHLGHFFLTDLLLEKMKATAKETGVQGRIINVSSAGHRCNGSYFDIEKLGDERKFNRYLAYPHSKLANILHAKELSRRFQVEGCNLTANSLHPGLIKTEIGRNSTLIDLLLSFLKLCRKSIPQGAATTCYLALHPNVEDVSGKYFEDCNEATPSALAEDEQLAKKVWHISEELVRRRKLD